MPRPFASLLIACAMGTPLAAQPATATLYGLVRDIQGAAIPGATIVIACGSERRQLTASASGEFTASNLPARSCRVTASSEHFEPESRLVDTSAANARVFELQVRRFASEVVVTPARGAEQPSFDVPETVSVVSRREIDSRPYTIFAQVLREEPGVLLQQTTTSQTSPIIRGFTGQSNVYLVDGVRLNTGAWRAGPNQYTAWVGGGLVDSVEVVRGSGSVQYGSDALGGTVQIRTSPRFGRSTGTVGGNAEAVVASADASVGGQVDLGLRYRSVSLRVGGSRRHVNDLRAGGGLDSHSAITRYFDLPSTLVYERQPATSFEQGGAYAVAEAAAGRGALLRALFMHESQTGASRYDRVLGGQGVFRSGFDPQALDFGLVRYARADAGFFDGVAATFSVNRQSDGRFEQSRPGARLDRQESATTAIGYQVQANRDFNGRHTFVAGAELYDESITASRELVEPNGVIRRDRPDIPDGTSYSNLGIFAQQALQVSNRLTLQGGLRVSRFGFGTTPDASLGVTEESVVSYSTTFQGSAVVALTERLNLTGSVTRAFRAANADDLGGIGLSGGGGFQITPSRARSLGAYVGSSGSASAVSTGERVSDLRPEVVYQYEVGLKARLGPVSGAVSAFDMELYDFIERRSLVFDTSIVGSVISGFEVVSQDASGLAYIAQDVRPIATAVNVSRGRIRGFDVEGEVQLHRAWTAHAHFSMLHGQSLPDGGYLRRMPPPMGGARLRWTGGRAWTEGVVTFAAAQTRLNSGDIGDARIGGLRTRSSIAGFFNGTATDMGLVQNGVLAATGETLAQVQSRVLGTADSAPLFTSHAGFAVVGVRAGVQISRVFDVAVMADNLADTNYRLYGSGVDAPGFNLQVRTRWRF